MVQIIGRLTADATIKTVGDNDVVNFTIAINDYYKPKGASQGIEQVTFIQCGYWFNSAIAASLRKGAVIEAGGRLFPTAYMRGNEPNGQINMQVQHIKVHVFAKKDEPQHEATEQPQLWQEPTQEKEGGTLNNEKPNKSRSRKLKPQPNHQPVTTAEGGDDLPF